MDSSEWATRYSWTPNMEPELMWIPPEAILELTNIKLDSLGGKTLLEYAAEQEEDDD